MGPHRSNSSRLPHRRPLIPVLKTLLATISSLRSLTYGSLAIPSPSEHRTGCPSPVCRSSQLWRKGTDEVQATSPTSSAWLLHEASGPRDVLSLRGYSALPLHTTVDPQFQMTIRATSPSFDRHYTRCARAGVLDKTTRTSKNTLFISTHQRMRIQGAARGTLEFRRVRGTRTLVSAVAVAVASAQCPVVPIKRIRGVVARCISYQRAPC
ncbi:hypothetical protein C8Q78DRAFT_247950 [Trametes maxima]|nr:hypothetical protein C8Q78DRAFT_247950 [Trametes maxima]